jgi:transposase
MPTPPFLLTTAQMHRLSPHFPLSHGKPRVDDRRVLSGIIYVIRHGLQWRDAPIAYGPHKTLYNRFVRPHGRVRSHLCRALRRRRPTCAADDRQHAPQSPSYRRQPPPKGAFPRCIGRTKGGLNSKLHAACDGQGRPVLFLLTEGQASDHRGAALMLPHLPAETQELIADRGYDSARFRDALTTRGITPCIPSTRSRKQSIPHDVLLYRQRYRVEIMFGRLKDWRRIAMRYDRCAQTFFSAIALAATVTFWLNQ